MSITAKDSLFEAAAGVAITAHTPSGTGAAGGAWSKPSASQGIISKAAGGFTGRGASVSGTCVLGSAVATSGYVQLDITYGGPNAPYQNAGAAAFKALGTNGDYYGFGLTGPVGSAAPSWALTKQVDSVSSTTFGSIAGPALTVGNIYTVRMEWAVSGSTVSFNCFVNGTNVGSGTDNGTVGSVAAYTGALTPGIVDYSGNLTAYANFIAGGLANLTAVTADNAGFSYAGRWGLSGTSMRTISNGADCRFSYTGQTCILNFDAAGVVKYPGIAYWIDGAGPTRALLDSTGQAILTPAYNTAPSGAPPFTSVRSNVHDVRFMANVDSEYPTTYDDWTNLRDALKFTGASLDSGATLLTAVPCQDYIEFLGDSITASLRLLYASGGADGPLLNAPETGWPEKVSQLLGLRAIVNGHGGQGITVAATDGTPAANSAFGFVYAGTAWNPTYKPRAVVVYQGTNDASITVPQYQALLATVRTAYPAAWIFAVVPFQKAVHAASIQTAVTNLANAKIVYLDYSAAFTVNTDTSDGTHFNPGGAVRMAAKLAGDIRASVPTIAGGGGAAFSVLGCSFIRGSQ